MIKAQIKQANNAFDISITKEKLEADPKRILTDEEIAVLAAQQYPQYNSMTTKDIWLNNELRKVYINGYKRGQNNRITYNQSKLPQTTETSPEYGC